LNILREDWRPVLDVNAVIYGLIQLFGHDVNSEDPLNREAAALLQTDRTQVGSYFSLGVNRGRAYLIMITCMHIDEY
jgi:ubiquitin-protein ligase